jgi:uncharacterized repeat protein (TIGR03843 family)
LARPDREDDGDPEDDLEDRVTAADLTPPLELPDDDAQILLSTGTISVEGQVVDASNATLYVRVEQDGVAAAAAYKPVSGERPLWDFPDGTLAEREVAAYTVSVLTGWGVVPPTVLRDGPFGPGMIQLWIATDEDVDVRQLIRGGSAQLRRIAVLDAVINNGDRKGGHLLPTSSGHVFGIDHGVTFNVDEKLRTVLWNWAGEVLEESEREVLEQLRTALDGPLADRLADLLTGAEVRRTRHRVDRLLRTGCLPMPSRDWPPVPWPAM